VHIGEDDELGSFVFRTTGFNSIRTLATRLRYFHAISGGLLSTLPLELRLRGKSTTQSHRSAIYYVGLTVRSGMTMAKSITSAKLQSAERNGLGFDQAALDAAARQGFADGAFEESEEEGASIVEEFYPEEAESSQQGKSAGNPTKLPLADKLNQKAAQLNGHSASASGSLAARSHDRD
jgi:Recombination directionality factor-like